jgi:hypothetical protein
MALEMQPDHWCVQKLHARAGEYESIGLIALGWLPANRQSYLVSTCARHRSVSKLRTTDSHFFVEDI